MSKDENLSRRPVTSRDKAWIKSLAIWLTRTGVRPNAISVASTFFAALAAAFLLMNSVSWWARVCLLGGVVFGILGRLMCNLLDGMVAVEGGQKTKSGEIFNDLPDRVSDVLIFVAMGYAAGWIQLGWAAALLAVMTAYVRYLGAGCGTPHFFSGPMAKQHRMAVSIGAAVASAALEPVLLPTASVFKAALVVIVAGAFVTCLNRVLKIVRFLENKP